MTANTGKSQRAYDWIHKKIAQHVYGPGHRLVLSSIADELHMSVVPVREALRRLEAEGMITFERNVGARVALVDEEEYLRTMQTIAIVEGAATALAAPLVSEEQLQAAAAVNAHMYGLLDQFDANHFSALNRNFHGILLQACPNPDLLTFANQQQTRLASVRDEASAFTLEGARRSIEEHEQLLQLIRSNADSFEIERLMRVHRLRTSAAFIAARHEHDLVSAMA